MTTNGQTINGVFIEDLYEFMAVKGILEKIQTHFVTLISNTKFTTDLHKAVHELKDRSSILDVTVNTINAIKYCVVFENFQVRTSNESDWHTNSFNIKVRTKWYKQNHLLSL